MQLRREGAHLSLGSSEPRQETPSTTNRLGATAGIREGISQSKQSSYVSTCGSKDGWTHGRREVCEIIPKCVFTARPLVQVPGTWLQAASSNESFDGLGHAGYVYSVTQPSDGPSLPWWPGSLSRQFSALISSALVNLHWLKDGETSISLQRPFARCHREFNLI